MPRSEPEGKLRAQLPSQGGVESVPRVEYQPYVPPDCPKCKSKNVKTTSGGRGYVRYFECANCHHGFSAGPRK